jgi:hypothetical protein
VAVEAKKEVSAVPVTEVKEEAKTETVNKQEIEEVKLEEASV